MTDAPAPASANAPKFDVGPLPGTPFAERLNRLRAQVEDQLEWDSDLNDYTPEMRELLTIVLRMEGLRDDPFRDVVRTSQIDGVDVFVTFLLGATFFHIVNGSQIWLLGAIFALDGPEGPELASRPGHSITCVARRRLRAMRGVDFSGDATGRLKPRLDAEDGAGVAPLTIARPFLMPIEEVCSISGCGAVVTGRVERGIVNVRDEVEIVGIRPGAECRAPVGRARRLSYEIFGTTDSETASPARSVSITGPSDDGAHQVLRDFLASRHEFVCEGLLLMAATMV
jgi:hypothetical protein